MARKYIVIPATAVVDVTDQDIDRGDGGNASQCALALAAKRALGLPAKSTAVSVDDGQVTVWNGHQSGNFDLGCEALRWMDQFDMWKSGLNKIRPEPRRFVAIRVEPRTQPEEISS
jgi:hypothetical protein